MPREPNISKTLLLQRWFRDFTSEQQVYVPERLASQSRMCKGFELRGDGSYRQISAGANDAINDSEGTWSIDDESILTLSPNEAAGNVRKIRVLEITRDRLIVVE